jgi:hypothetical protein
MAKKSSKNNEKTASELETKVEPTLSTAEIAAAAGVSSQYIARLKRAGVIAKSGYGRHAASELGKIIAFRAGEPGPGEESPASLTQERTLLVKAQREKAELDLAERRGELQSRAEAEACAAGLVTVTRNRLLAVPERVASRTRPAAARRRGGSGRKSERL